MAKILLVDDHPDIVRLLQICLRDQGHELLTAYDGQKALDLLYAERPDIVILDVVMPLVDGLRVLNRIKTDANLHQTVVVMLTVQDKPEDVTLGLDIGADFYLSKPFKPADVSSLIRRICETQTVR